MANYVATARTNYVRIEDIEGLYGALAPWGIEVVEDSEKEGCYAFMKDDGEGWPSWIVDEADNEIEFSFEENIMPYVAEGEVLIAMEVGAEKLRYVVGEALAFIRKGGEIRQIRVSLADIYDKAVDEFNVPPDTISTAEY